MKSVWESDAPRIRFRELCANESTDVLIVGGGIAGILCAYKLKNAGVAPEKEKFPVAHTLQKRHGIAGVKRVRKCRSAPGFPLVL